MVHLSVFIGGFWDQKIILFHTGDGSAPYLKSVPLTANSTTICMKAK